MERAYDGGVGGRGEAGGGGVGGEDLVRNRVVRAVVCNNTDCERC